MKQNLCVFLKDLQIINNQSLITKNKIDSLEKWIE